MKTKTILVIEDNPLNMEIVVDILELHRYKALQAFDAETGIQMARAHKPDMILMDIQLPGMDGLSATRRLKEDPALRTIPVVALTAYAMKSDEDEAIKAGCCAYLSKPFHIESLVELIKEHLA